MRALANAERIRQLLTALARQTDEETTIYLTGGATAVLIGWRLSTIDADLLIDPERDDIFRALPRLKEDLQLNIELANPAHFIPELPGWRERSVFVAREGHVSFYHYDPYAQALAKLERGHDKDLVDVQEFIGRGLVDPRKLRSLFEAIKPRLHRYPGVDPASFRRRMEELLARVAGP